MRRLTELPLNPIAVRRAQAEAEPRTGASGLRGPRARTAGDNEGIGRLTAIGV
jgi:hypothetical protein